MIKIDFVDFDLTHKIDLIMATFNKNYLEEVAKFQETTIEVLLDRGFPSRTIISGYLEVSYAKDAINEFRNSLGLNEIDKQHLVLFLSNPDTGDKKPKAIHFVNSAENVWHLNKPVAKTGINGVPDKTNLAPTSNEFLPNGEFWYKLNGSWEKETFDNFLKIAIVGGKVDQTPTPPHSTSRFNFV